MCLKGRFRKDSSRHFAHLDGQTQLRAPEDCILSNYEARRQIAPGKWQSVRIEFEYESRHFHEHGHDTAGCDLIICWGHNWPDCPEKLAVIALDEEIKKVNGANPDLVQGTGRASSAGYFAFTCERTLR